MKFFEFSQNNSGGSFDCDEYVAHRVLIEAENADEAILKGESLGMYWDGCESGMDCDCCGDRWYKPWGNDGKEFPYNYGSFKVSDASEIVDSYEDVELNPIKDKTRKFGGRYSHDIIFKTPESYMQYMADKYGWTKPDGYIHYKNGNKVSIFSTKIK
jgi:hypothetical protein